MLVIVYFHLILGEILGKIWLVVSLASMFSQTMTFYGCFSNIISKRGDAPRSISLGIGASAGLMSIYKWCSEAQKVEECVSIICIFLHKQRAVKIFRCPIEPVLQVD
jgi:hypothetical protein